jgi:hypothetical protein
MNHVHVSPTGDDSGPGTPERPFATLERARDHVRTLTGDATVHLRAGVHTLTAPLLLTGEDSGRDGRRIVYQAHGYGTPGREEATVSGGREISGWRERDGLWLADVGDLHTRQLYVDGRRAGRGALEGVPGNVTVTETGYVTDSTDPQRWGNPSDVEFVYRGVYPWTEARCGVASVSGDERSTTITMDRPAFAWAAELYNSVVPWAGESHGPGLPTRVENGAGFLTEPGTFALDRSVPGRHVLLYRPLPGEDPARTRVVAPVLETLIHARGVHDVAFRGIVFADATWLRPSRPEGFLHYHGIGYYEGGGVERATFAEGEAWVTFPRESAAMPGNVVFEDTGRVLVEGCRFTRLGAVGLEFSGGSVDDHVLGNVFDDISGAALAIRSASPAEGRGNRVEDNRIRHVGVEYAGSPGITLSATQDSVIAHNHVSDVPHCGIVLGGGEGARGARVLHNLVHDTMQVLADGGGVYLSGPQGDSAETAAVVRGNVVRDTLTPYNFALYTDYGASWVTVEGNAVHRADNTAVLQVWPPLENVVYRGNFWDADPVGHDAPPAGVVHEGNVTITDEEKFREATAEIRLRAGLRSPSR